MIKSTFLRSTVVMMSGTIMSQLILLACSPLLSRLYTPSDFGDFANYNALAAIMAIVSSLRYEHAILIARNRIKTNHVFVLTILLTLISFLLFSGVFAALRKTNYNFNYLDKISDFFHLIPFGVLVLCLYSACLQIFIKEGKFKLVSSLALINVAATLLLQIAVTQNNISNGLIIGNILGFLICILVIAVVFFKEKRYKHFFYQMNLRSLFGTAKDYIKFPRFNLPTDILSTLSQQFAPVFILMLFNATIAGTYSFAMRIIRMPVFVFSTSVTTVLRKRTGGFAALNREMLVQMHQKLVTIMALMALLPIGILVLFGAQIFEFVFGAQWELAGRLSQILSIGVFFEFIGYPLSVFFVTTGRQQTLFRIQLFNSLLLLAAILLGKQYQSNFFLVSIFISGSMVVSNLILIYFSRQACGAYDIKY